MGKTASITLLAATLLMAGAATANPAYVDHSRHRAHAPSAHERTYVPGHWERRGPHRVWVQAHWVVTPRHASPRPPARHAGFGAQHDRDRDGIPNRFDRDRDGDGVPNRFDRAPDSRRWQ